MEPVRCPASTLEQAMKSQEVILRAIDGRLKSYQAAKILGIPDPQIRRWRRPHHQCATMGATRRHRQQLSTTRPVPSTALGSSHRRAPGRAFHLDGNISSIQILEQFFNFFALVLELADARQVHPSVSDEILAQGRH